MNKDGLRSIVYQLVEARRTLQEIMEGKADPKEAPLAYFTRFCFVGPTKDEVDKFFASLVGQQVMRQLGIEHTLRGR